VRHQGISRAAKTCRAVLLRHAKAMMAHTT